MGTLHFPTRLAIYQMSFPNPRGQQLAFLQSVFFFSQLKADGWIVQNNSNAGIHDLWISIPRVCPIIDREA